MSVQAESVREGQRWEVRVWELPCCPQLAEPQAGALRGESERLVLLGGERPRHNRGKPVGWGATPSGT